MRKIVVLILTLALVFSLAACGGSDEVTLVETTTEQGITLVLPSDMPLQTVNGATTYINTETGDNATFVVSEVGDTPISDWTEDTVIATFQPSYPDVAIASFENGVSINGQEALVASLTLTSPKGLPLGITFVVVTDGTYNYVANFTYGADSTDSSLAANLQACIDSIQIP